MGSSASTPAAVDPTAGMNATDVTAFIKSENEANKVVVWSKSYCPYCTATKGLFAGGEQEATVKIHELDQMAQGNAIQHELAKLTGQRTVPNVFVNGSHLGGNDDTQKAFADGSIAEMLAK